MRLWGLLVVAWAGCYQAPTSDEHCTISCETTAGCPGDLTCRGGFCVSGDQVCRPLFQELAAGTGFACALDESGERWCWGSNAHHQISPAGELQFPYAVRVDLDRHWQHLEAGGEHICGIRDGQLYCWGNNDRGQVTDTIGGDVTEPFEITTTNGPSAWTAVSTGFQTTCAIGDRKLWCWGANERGQLGDGTMSDRGAPVLVAGGIDDWSAVAAGAQHTCAISESRGVYCWGDNAFNQVGTGATNPQLVPNQIVDAQSQPTLASSVAVSLESACATKVGGQLVCWGSNGANELGEQQNGQTSSVVPLSATLTTGWTQVAAARHYFCGIRNGETVCWGTTRFGGLGNGFWVQGVGEHVFATVSGTGGTTQISVGWDHDLDSVTGTNREDLALSCALVGTDILCWGENRFGQLGIGAATMELTPKEVSGKHTWSDLQAGLDHVCGVDGDKLYCWGSTEFGAANNSYAGGQGTRACDQNLDCDVPAPKELVFYAPSPTTRVALGAYHSCAYHDGKITCWGDNRFNQLVSNATPAPRQRDIMAPGGAAWTSAVQTGRTGQCGTYRVGTSNAIACWGNVLAPRTSVAMMGPPFDKQTGLALGSTVAGINYDCILDATQTLQCQGDNQVYEYGDGSMMDALMLAPTNPPRTYSAIATSTDAPTICGLRGGQVECWGANDRGQTGAATVGSPTMTPNVVTGLVSCTAIAVGREHACAICDGSVRCWGDNRVGELGTGELDAAPSSVPRTTLDPPAAGSWIQLVAGAHFTCARSDDGHTECWGSAPHSALGTGGRSANLPALVRATPAP